MAVNPVQVQKFIGGVDYPATREELIEHADAAGADDEVLEALSQMPDETFETPGDVIDALDEMGL